MIMKTSTQFLAAVAALSLLTISAYTQTITIGSDGANTTDSTDYSGGVSLVKIGSNTVTLTGSNSYTGATTVSNGVLESGINGAFSAGSKFTLNGGTININGTTNTIVSLNIINGNVLQTNGSLTSTFATFPSVIIGSTLGGSGTYTLQGGCLGGTNNSQFQLGYYGTGVFNQTGGTNSFDGYFIVGRYSPGGNGTYNLTGGLAQQSSVNHVSIIGEDGTGVMNVSGTGVFSNAGKIIIASTANANGTLNIRDGGTVIAPGIDFGSGKGRVVFDRTDNSNFAIPINGNGSVTKNGSGTVTLTAVNAYAGATTVSNGVLSAGINGAFSTNSTFTLNGGSIDLGVTTQSIWKIEILSGTNSQTNGSLTTLLPSLEAIVLAPLAGNSATYNLSGGYLGTTNLSAPSQNPGNLQVGYRGTGVFNQSGGTNNIAGYFIVGRFSPGGNGTYNLTGGLAQQSSANRVSIIGEDGTGVMNVSSGGVFSNTGKILIGWSANANGTLNIQDAGTVIAPGIDFGPGTGRVVFERTDSTNFAIPINGNGSVIKNGTGTVTLTVNNGYTKGTTVNAGTLIVQGLANNANNTVTVNSGGTFVFNANNTFGNHSANVVTPIVINSGGLVTNGGNFVNALGPITFNGGTLAVGGVNSGYSYLLKGGVTVNSNSTISGPGVALGSAAVSGTDFTVAGGATLTVNGGLLNGPAPSWPTPQASYLIKDGAGTMLLNGTNTFTGTTTISEGALWIGTTGLLGSGNYGENISNNGMLIYGGANNQTLGGTISGSGALVQSGTASLTLTGDNTYSGTTTVTNGTLVLNGTHTNGAAYTIQSGGTLLGTGRTASSVTVNSGGVIQPGSGSTIGSLTIGGLTLNGTLSILLGGATSSLLEVKGDFNNNGMVSFTTNAALTADLYPFLNYTGAYSGAFAGSLTNTNGIPAGFFLISDTQDKVLLLAKSNNTLEVAPLYTNGQSLITGGSNSFGIFAYNPNSNPVTFSVTNSTWTAGGIGSLTLGSSAETNAGTMFFTGTNVGTNTGAFVVNAGTNTATNAVQFVVYDHASNVVTGTNLSFGAVHRGAATASSTNSITVSNSSSGFRIALGVTNNNTNPYLTIDTASGLAQGESADLFGQLDLSRVSLGYFTNTAQLIAYDDSVLNGASTNVGTTEVTITGYVYSGQGVWTSSSGGNWSDFANWQVDGGTPGLDGALSVADTATFGINGSGSVTLDTNASLLSVTFSNTNSYTIGGSETLTLAASGATDASIATLAGSHTITSAVGISGNVLLTNASDTTLSISGSINGDGALIKQGEGTTILTGSNGFIGNVSIQGGTLSATNGALGYSSVSVSAGRLAPIGPDSLSVLGDLSFTTTNAAYLWTLYDNTTSGPGTNFTAPTEVGGKLSVATNAHFQMFFTTNVDASNDFWDANESLTNTWLVMTGSDLAEGSNFRATFAPGSTTNGFDQSNFFFTVTNGGLYLNFTPGLIVFPGPDEFHPGTNYYPWVVYQPGGELDIPAGVNLVIKAAVTMSNNSTTIVNGQYTSLAGSFTLMNGSTLGGNGTLNGNLISSGLVSPGNSPGTLTIAGNYTQTSAGSFLLQAASLSVFDRLVVTGTASLAGTLNATGYGGYALAPGTKFQFLTASGGITGTFDTIALDNPTLRGRFVVGGTNNSLGTLLIAPLTYSQMASTPNEASVAKALDPFISATSGDRLVVSTALDGLTASQYQQAFAAIAPTLYQSLSTMAFNAVNAQYNDLVQQMFGLRVAGSGFSMKGFADNTVVLEGQGDGDKGVLASKKDILRPGMDNRWGMFVDGNGIFAQANSGNMLQNYNAQSGGFVSGLTYKWNPAVATGIYAGYQGTYAKFGYPYSGSTVIDNAVRFGVLGTFGDPSGKGFYGDALVGGTYNNYSVTRAISFPGLSRTANSSPGAGELDSMIAAGYNWRKGNWAFGPVSSLQYTYFGMNSFNETGAQSLDYQGLNWNTASMIYNLGANCAYSWQATRNLMVVPQINLAWQHEFMQNPYAINGNLSGTPVANTSSTPLRDTLYTGIGVTLEFKKRWNTAFFYNAAAGNSDLISQNIFWSAGVKF